MVNQKKAWKKLFRKVKVDKFFLGLWNFNLIIKKIEYDCLLCKQWFVFSCEPISRYFIFLFQLFPFFLFINASIYYIFFTCIMLSCREVCPCDMTVISYAYITTISFMPNKYLSCRIRIIYKKYSSILEL